jgi:putative nucleotidyltransferase with HDIG domain
MFSRTAVRKIILYTILFLAVFGLAYIFVILPLMPGLGSQPLEVGQVASQDYISPRSFSYESDVLSNQQRDNAANLVQPVYTSPDTNVARQQVGRLRDTLAYITAIRSDNYASNEQKLADLAAMEDIELHSETAQNILALSDPRWQAVQQETINVLEQVMRNTIREDRLEEARRMVPTRVSLSLPEDQAAIVSELAAAFVAPNSFYSADLTEAARQQAREDVQPVTRTYLTGETIVQRGRVITQADIEALQEAGLVEPTSPWQEQAGALAIILVAAVFSVMYLQRRPLITSDPRSLILIAGLFLVFLGVARLLVMGHVVLPYLFPITAFSLTLASLYGVQPAVMLTLPLVILITYGIPGALELTLFYIFSALFGIFTLGQGRRISSFLRASLTSSFAGIIIILAYRLGNAETDLIGLLTLAGAALFNGAVSAGLAVILQFFLAQFLGMTTPLQLMDLSRPDHPLLQFILRRAPGTYQHSLQVANLAEQAAERINADALLTRVGALYHDAGKALNPTFFIENQLSPAQNPHNDLDPETSAAIIIRHVSDGLDLARKHRLPRRIQDFIAEHHGDSITRYQYITALEAAGGDESLVDVQHFRYPGPKPQSRETAILMLADSSEAVTRAKTPKNEEELRATLKSVIESRLAEGQLDETTLTIRDLNEILDSFAGTLKGVYHPRIEYPRLSEREPHELTGDQQLPPLPEKTGETAELSPEMLQERRAAASDVPTRPADSANLPPNLPPGPQPDSPS